MEKEIILTPEELYYLGGVMEAKYIDYAYVSAMEDIQQNHAIYERDAKNGLEKKGILEEDFSGNFEISSDGSRLLSPLFFGEFESSIGVTKREDSDRTETTRFHYLDGRVVKVTEKDRQWHLQEYSPEKVEQDIQNLLPDGAKSEIQEGEEIFETDKVTDILVLKHVHIGIDSLVKVYFYCGDKIFSENEQEDIVLQKPAELLKEMKQIVGEE
jgi:hypothetical protein